MEYPQDFELTAEGLLEFKDGIVAPEPDVRRLEDARFVLSQDMQLDAAPLYYMYRGVFHEGQKELFTRRNIRYDLTVILPGLIGREFNKTVGHFHPLKPGSNETFPEFYEVLFGEALYLLQKNSRSGDVEEILAVAAQKGDKVFIPPGYGHVTINPGEQPLVMANLIEANFSSLYEPFREKRGAAYYYIQGENGKGEFIKNTEYHNSVGLKMMCAPNLDNPLAETKEKGLYEAFLENPEEFDILK